MHIQDPHTRDPLTRYQDVLFKQTVEGNRLTGPPYRTPLRALLNLGSGQACARSPYQAHLHTLRNPGSGH